MQPYVLAVDLGGTRMRVAIVDANYRLLARVEQPTRAHEGPDVVIPRLIALIHSVLKVADVPIAAIGLSSPGPIEPKSGAILSPPNLPGWVDVPLGRLIGETVDIPVYIGNDANVAALAEVEHGAAKGHKNAIYITVSTGIGGGIVIDGRLFLGDHGLAGELGHIVFLNEAGEVSSLEEEAAGPALAEYAVKRIRAGEASLIAELVNGDLDKVSGKTVGEAAEAGDPLARALVERTGRFVGYAIASMMHLFDPSIFVVGGGVTNLGDMLFAPMRQAACERVIDPAYCEHTDIVPAALGEDVAIIGAAALAFQELGAA